MRNVPISQQVCCRGLSPLLTKTLCRQLRTSSRASQEPLQTAGEPPQNHISLLGQWSTPALACSDFRGQGRSSPALAVLWVEFLPGLHPARAAFPTQPPRKPESTPSAWQGAQLRILVLLKQHQEHLSVCMSIYPYTQKKPPSSSWHYLWSRGKEMLKSLCLNHWTGIKINLGSFLNFTTIFLWVSAAYEILSYPGNPSL